MVELESCQPYHESAVGVQHDGDGSGGFRLADSTAASLHIRIRRSLRGWSTQWDMG